MNLWRLPTIYELEYICNNQERLNLALKQSDYWSCTNAEDAKNHAYYVNMSRRDVDYYFKAGRHRVRFVQIQPYESLPISLNTSVGVRFEFNGEEVVFGGVDENGMAFLIAAQDEPYPENNDLMNWYDAESAAEVKNQSSSFQSEQPIKKKIGPQI